MECPYSSFTDEDGHYEIEIMDASGVTPKKNARQRKGVPNRRVRRYLSQRFFSFARHF